MRDDMAEGGADIDAGDAVPRSRGRENKLLAADVGGDEVVGPPLPNAADGAEATLAVLDGRLPSPAGGCGDSDAGLVADAELDDEVGRERGRAPP